MEAAKSQAVRILSNLGFYVEQIPVEHNPVARSRTADLRVNDEESVYLVEVKEKFEAESVAAVRTACLLRGEVFEESDLLAHDNRISGVLRDARDQLDKTPKNLGTFQLIWFHAGGLDAEVKYRQAFATFYGEVPLIAIQPRRSETKTCFYFDYSASFAMPTVAALILTDSRQLQLCLNEFAESADAFRATRLYRNLLALDGVIDPVALASAGQIIACRAMMRRRDDGEIVKALQEQTGTLYLPIRLTMHACSAAVTKP